MEKHMERYLAIKKEFKNFLQLWEELGKNITLQQKFVKNYHKDLFRINELVHCTTFGHEALKTLCERFYWSGLFKKVTLTSNEGAKHYFLISHLNQRDNLLQLRGLLEGITVEHFDTSSSVFLNHVRDMIRAIDEEQESIKSKSQNNEQQ